MAILSINASSTFADPSFLYSLLVIFSIFLDDHYQHCELDKRLNIYIDFSLNLLKNCQPFPSALLQQSAWSDCRPTSQRWQKIIEMAEPEAVGPGRYPVSEAVQMGTKAIWRGQPLLIPGRLLPERVIRIGKFGISVCIFFFSVWILTDRVLEFTLLKG